MQAIQGFHCVGCGRSIPWDGTGIFAYTCACGANLFATDKGYISFPASLAMAKEGKIEIPHLDYYLGISNYVSAEKQKAYDDLRKLGSVWSWECDECRERYLKLRKAQLKEGFFRFELLPELLELLKNVKY